MKNNLSIDYRIYLVADDSVPNLNKLLELALKNGVTIVQYRNKTDIDSVFLAKAKKIQQLCQKYHVPFVINDNLNVAITLKSDGLHIGQDDIDIQLVKQKFAGFIGISCQTELQIKKAINAGADYIGLGAIYPSQTKPNAIIVKTSVLAANSDSQIPIVLIGGMNAKTVPQLVNKYHYQNFAFVSYILRSSNMKRDINYIKNILLLN